MQQRTFLSLRGQERASGTFHATLFFCLCQCKIHETYVRSSSCMNSFCRSFIHNFVTESMSHVTFLLQTQAVTVTCQLPQRFAGNAAKLFRSVHHLHARCRQSSSASSEHCRYDIIHHNGQASSNRQVRQRRLNPEGSTQLVSTPIRHVTSR